MMQVDISQGSAAPPIDAAQLADIEKFEVQLQR
jgi:hypothetical protein